MATVSSRRCETARSGPRARRRAVGVPGCSRAFDSGPWRSTITRTRSKHRRVHACAGRRWGVNAVRVGIGLDMVFVVAPLGCPWADRFQSTAHSSCRRGERRRRECALVGHGGTTLITPATCVERLDIREAGGLCRDGGLAARVVHPQAPGALREVWGTGALTSHFETRSDAGACAVSGRPLAMHIERS